MLKKTDEVRLQQHLLRGLSPNEAAEKMGISVSYVMKLIKRMNSEVDDSMIRLCSNNILEWLTKTYKMRISELWKMYENTQDVAQKVECLKLIRAEDVLLLETAERFNLTAGRKSDLDEFMTNLADAMAVLSVYQRERIREIIIRAINDGLNITGKNVESITDNREKTS